jgi:hypothetical protein
LKIRIVFGLLVLGFIAQASNVLSLPVSPDLLAGFPDPCCDTATFGPSVTDASLDDSTGGYLNYDISPTDKIVCETLAYFWLQPGHVICSPVPTSPLVSWIVPFLGTYTPPPVVISTPPSGNETPPAVTPEPSMMFILVLGFVAMLFGAHRTRFHALF